MVSFSRVLLALLQEWLNPDTHRIWIDPETVDKRKMIFETPINRCSPCPLKMNKDELYSIYPPDNFSKPKKFWFMIFLWTSTFRTSYSFTFITYWRNTKFSLFIPMLPCIALQGGCVANTMRVTVHLPRVVKVSNAAQSDILKPAQESGPPAVNNTLEPNTCWRWAPFAQ